MTHNILHIAPHYGGGVGSVVNSWIANDTSNTHTLTYLNDIPENKKPGVSLFEQPLKMSEHDVIVCHVWNHPSMFEFLIESKLPPCRMIGWSHMSGLHAPYVLSEKLINYFDEFYYTSPISNLTGIRREYIWSTCDIKDYLKIQRAPHEGFVVGYIGTLDYCKLHPQFLDICESINVPGARFVVVGTGCDADDMQKEARRRGINVEFTGLVGDVRPYLEMFDVFLYPLYEKHFGTCEQVLGEALAAGLPCVVMGNEAERFIISDNVNGFVCYDIDEIPGIVESIHSGRITLDYDLVRERAADMYSIENEIEKWNAAFDGVMKHPARVHKWYDIFIESLGRCGDSIRRQLNYNDMTGIAETFNTSNQWKSKSKGSIRQYLDYYPDDPVIQKLAELL